MGASKVQRVTINVPTKLTAKQRLALSAEIIDFIRKRSDKSLDKDNQKFAAYSKEYKQFKGSSKVDLKLSGDMLAAMYAIWNKPGKIRIGFDSGQENDRAEGNILGTYGQPTPIPGKKRDFLGIHPSDLKNIIKKVETVTDKGLAAAIARSLTVKDVREK